MKLLILVSLYIMTSVISGDWEAYKQAIKRFSEMGIDNDPLYVQSRSQEVPKALNFPCKAIPASPSVPTSVHRLRPSDIKIVGAIGDSLTAANGAKAVLLTGLLTEYRGLSWSMGGDSNIGSVVTLPNMLRVYNPELKGFSTGTGSYTTAGAKYNVAQPGHTANEMLVQAQTLVSRIKSADPTGYANDWKVITFFVGGNDLCKQCKDTAKYTPERYTDNIRQTLDYFQSNLPKTLVNLVLTLDVSGIEVLSSGFVCKTMHNYLCECGITEANKPVLDYLVSNYQRLVTSLVDSGRYDTTETFTVVLQPFMKEMKPPLLANGNPDYSFFAPDCFHFSEKGHQTAALELWNNMLQPVGKKSTVWSAIVTEIICPTEAKPYIYTNKNSN